MIRRAIVLKVIASGRPDGTGNAETPAGKRILASIQSERRRRGGGINAARTRPAFFASEAHKGGAVIAEHERAACNEASGQL